MSDIFVGWDVPGNRNQVYAKQDETIQRGQCVSQQVSYSIHECVLVVLATTTNQTQHKINPKAPAHNTY